VKYEVQLEDLVPFHDSCSLYIKLNPPTFRIIFMKNLHTFWTVQYTVMHDSKHNNKGYILLLSEDFNFMILLQRDVLLMFSESNENK
jgi:hypothetical protein